MADLIDRKKAMAEAFTIMIEGEPFEIVQMETLWSLPPVDAVPVVRCKDCKHFEYNHWEKVNGVPLIVAHEICKRWGDGCKTSEDGFCFVGERKETEDE